VAKRTVVFHSTATTETITGLGSGQTLTFVVRAVNKRGAGPPSGHSKPVRIR